MSFSTQNSFSLKECRVNDSLSPFYFHGMSLSFKPFYYIDLFYHTGSSGPVFVNDPSLSYLNLLAFHIVPQMETWPQFPLHLLLWTCVAVGGFSLIPGISA